MPQAADVEVEEREISARVLSGSRCASGTPSVHVLLPGHPAVQILKTKKACNHSA